MSSDVESCGCPLHCEADDSVVLRGRDILHGLPGEFTVVRCEACGLMRTDPRPTPQSMAFYYPSNYGPYAGTLIGQPSVSDAHERTIKRIFKPLIQRVFDTKAQALPKMEPGRMLEIGCASGAFLHQMAQRGWHVEGVEFSEMAAAAARSRGYTVHAGSLETAPAPSQPVDLVVGWMVLEHLHDPLSCLRKLGDWSSADAWLALSVPNAKSAEFAVFKQNWYALQLPTHLHHFTPEALTLLLKEAGWSVQAIHHQRSVANLLLSIAYLADGRGLPRLSRVLRKWAWGRGIRFYLLFPAAWALSLFGQTGRMTVWARRQRTPSQGHKSDCYCPDRTTA